VLAAGFDSVLTTEMRSASDHPGKVVLAEYFWDHQEALEAAGLSE
jgi:hypothetical protein